MTVRPAQHDDAAEIASIYNEAVLTSTATADYEPHTAEQRTEWLEHHRVIDCPVVVAVDDANGDSLVGWGSLTPFRDRIGYRHTLEDSLYITESHRGRGIGKLILADLIAIAEARGAHAIIAAISGGNLASERLHAGLGFETYGRLPELIRKFDQWIDVVYMVRLLK